METKKANTKWLIDAVLFTGFIIAVLLDLTGLALHQWLGVVIGALALYHLGNHWSWVTAVTGRFFGHTSQKARIYYLVDAGLVLGFTLILFTGLAISTWLSLSLANYTAWKNLHILTTIVTLLLIMFKISIHWRWIVQIARRSIFTPPVSMHEKRSVPQPALAPISTGRRDFLKLMGVVGAAVFIALGSALDSVEGTSGSEFNSSQQTNAQGSSYSTAVQGSSNSLNGSSACSVMCPRGCSYPGHCRRYVDSDGNRRCDLGECA